jgi:hypothetical protein
LNLKPEQSNIFFKLMEERYRRRPTVITGGPLGLSTRFAKFRNGTEKCESGLVSYLVEMMTLRCWKRAMFRYRHCIFFKTPSFTNHIPFVFNVGCPTTRLRGSQKRAQSTARSGIRLTPSRWPQVNAIDDNP